MATYVIGDIHGHFETLQALLARLDFQAAEDHLWLTGDLVNRGPNSLDVLRWARRWGDRLAERMVWVLGNHDLHLASLALEVRPVKPKDADLVPILEAPDGAELVKWLLRRPLLHRVGEAVLVHAGVLPSWDVETAEASARRLEGLLRRRSKAGRLLDPSQGGKWTALRRDLDILTRLRTLTTEGEPCAFSGPPREAPRGCLPWFAHDGRRTAAVEVLFGHWAALGLYRGEGVTCLDSGCAWGGHLSALRLEDRRLWQQKVLETSPAP